MASGIVRKSIQDKILTLLQNALDINSNADYKVRTFSRRLTDLPIAELPNIVVTVRQKSQSGPGEFGTVKELWAWEVQIYYLDISDDYDQGEMRRDKVTDDIETVLEKAYRLDGLSVTINNLGNTETVFDSNFSSVLFDSSGQDGYYTFVSELYFTVNTQRN